MSCTLALTAVAHPNIRADDGAEYEFFASLGSADGSASRTATLLRSSLRKYIKSVGLTAESALTLEYSPALGAPETQPSVSTDDWVGAVDAHSDSDFIAAGLFSGALTLFRASSLTGTAPGSRVALATVAAHDGPLTSLQLFEAGDVPCVATGGRDGAVRLWSARAAAAGSGGTATATAVTLSPFAELEGASAGVGCVRVDPSGRLVVAGDDKGALALWSVPTLPSPAVSTDAPGKDGAMPPPPLPSAKRARRGTSADVGVAPPPIAPPAAVSVRRALFSLGAAPAGVGTAHGGSPVGGVAWLSSSSVSSGGWDRAIRVWDLEGATGATLRATVWAAKAVTGLTATPMGSVVGSSHPDGVVRVWDTREDATSVPPPKGTTALAAGQRASLLLPAAAPGGDAPWLSAVAWSRRNAHHVAAAAHDGTVALWDVRAPGAPVVRSVHGATALAAAAAAAASAGASEAPPPKALGLAWLGGDAGAGGAGIVSGGADRELRTAMLPGL